MRINRVDLQQLRMPLKEPFQTSFGRLTYKELILVRVHSEGEVGVAESVAMPFPIYNEETNGTVWYMLEKFLIPIILSSEIAHPSEVTTLFSAIRRNNMAKAAIEGAVWDLYSKLQGIPLSIALGGKAKEIEVGVSIGIENNIETLLRKVEGFLNDGYKKIKVKIKPGWDTKPIDAIRDTFGYEVPLMADANSAYTLDNIDTLKQLDEYQLMMIEQPLAHDDIIDHSKLQAQLRSPICLDESIHSVGDARKAIELGSCKIINIKIGRVGGLSEAKKIHDLCAKHNVPLWCGGMLEAGVGRAHNIAITTLDNFTLPGDTSASARYWEEDIILPEVTLSKPGIITVPPHPGIGYKINEKAVGNYLMKEQSYTDSKAGSDFFSVTSV